MLVRVIQDPNIDRPTATYPLPMMAFDCLWWLLIASDGLQWPMIASDCIE
jgi:hypothetical protein